MSLITGTVLGGTIAMCDTGSCRKNKYKIRFNGLKQSVSTAIYYQVTAKGNPRDVIHMMEDLLKEGIVEVDHNLGAVVILKELSENSLKIKVAGAHQINIGGTRNEPNSWVLYDVAEGSIVTCRGETKY